MNTLYNNDHYRNHGSFMNRMRKSHLMKLTAIASLFIIFCTYITDAAPLNGIDDSHISSPNRKSSIANYRKDLQLKAPPDNRKSKIANRKSQNLTFTPISAVITFRPFGSVSPRKSELREML